MSRHSFQGKLAWPVGLLVIGLMVTACSSALAKTADLGAGCDQFSSQKSVNQQAEVAVGDSIKVNLCSNPSTGFSWQEPEFSDTAVVSLVDKTFDAATADGDRPGGRRRGHRLHHPEGDRQGHRQRGSEVQSALGGRNLGRVDVHADGYRQVAGRSAGYPAEHAFAASQERAPMTRRPLTIPRTPMCPPRRSGFRSREPTAGGHWSSGRRGWAIGTRGVTPTVAT